MPVPYLNKVAKQTKLPLMEVEKIWEEAKDIADKSTTKRDSKYWALVTTIFKNKIESKTKISLEDDGIAIESLTISVEDNNTIGDVHQETEICYIAYMKNPDGLNKANRIYEMEQYSIKRKEGDKNLGEIRIRRSNQIYPKTDLQFYITIKGHERSGVITTCTETNDKVTETFYNEFKKLATDSSKKIRYVFKQENVVVKAMYKNEFTNITLPYLNYEVDVYSENTNEIIHNWVKIDIELDHVIEYIQYYLKDHQKILINKEDLKLVVPLDNLPIQITDAFFSNAATGKQLEIKNALYQKNIFKNNVS